MCSSRCWRSASSGCCGSTRRAAISARSISSSCCRSLSFILLLGCAADRACRRSSTALWGGVLVTIVVAAVGIVFSLPLGILLALGRRSHMPAVRLFSVIFIEFVRGVPLITVLFMASVMLPLFVPDSLVAGQAAARAGRRRAVRLGLYGRGGARRPAGDPARASTRRAMALGLGYWQMMRLIVLPQALRSPSRTSSTPIIGLFKDTTLVFIVGIFDFLRTIEVARVDPKWATPVTSDHRLCLRRDLLFRSSATACRAMRACVEAPARAGDRR